MVCPSVFYKTTFLLGTVITPVSADSSSLGHAALGTLAGMYCFPVQAHNLSNILFILHILNKFSYKYTMLLEQIIETKRPNTLLR